MRDADSGGWSATAGRRIRRRRRRAPSRTPRPGGWRSSPRAPRSVTSTGFAAISVAAQQHGLVVLDAAGDAAPAGEALERHRVGARRRLVARPARRRRGRRGPTRAARSRSPRSRSRSSRGCTAPSPRSSPGSPTCCLPHDWLALRLTGELGTDRGDASGTGYWSAATGEYRLDLLEIVDPDLDWARGASSRPRARSRDWAPATTWPPRSGSGCAPATSRSRSARRAPCSRSATRRPPTRPARCAGSPTRPAGTSRSSAR